MCRLLIFLTFIAVPSALSARDFHHQAQIAHKLVPGWQEPGFWRPKWVMTRFFDDDEGEKIDRLYFKLKSDRTISIFRSKNRPWLEIFNFNRGGSQLKNSKKRSETELEEAMEAATPEEMLKQLKKKNTSKARQVDGTWWWQDMAPIKMGRVKLETREGPEEEKILHECKCEWGKLDSYAAKFKMGNILKYRNTDAGVPLGTYAVGNFIIGVSPHRPLVSKEFTAFQ